MVKATPPLKNNNKETKKQHNNKTRLFELVYHLNC